MILQPFASEDVERIGKLQPETWPDIKPIFAYYIKSTFCHPIKLEIDHDIVGVGAAISYEKTGWLAHIIVSDGYRNQGIGGFIVDELCRYLKALGHETILLIATELGYPVYKKAGFEEETKYLYLKSDKPLHFETSNNILPITPEYFPEISKLDRKATGEGRQALLADYWHEGFIYLGKQGMRGFYLPNFVEGQVLAEDPEAGIELLKLRCAYTQRAALPADNEAALRFYRENGYEVVLKATRMVLGRKIAWRPDKIFNRIGGNFG